ncbi:alpha/beta fold hydrolase [Novosphingobium sp. FSY-8]|uniref:Alpha/beta fold hydrolase n=1 Tax=Novosphingobium ovatum TaxID=1908523 RepID=A0ABW9X9Z1_9SPHN|nr:alpha/beta fold hydrolase [Novosphingobium ovatum]NBC35356.1 alpha/beta fold hydrolase [Novosphingobium ovatum]
MTITKAYAPSRYGQIHYRLCLPQGPVSAPPILCLHQTPSNSHEWRALMPHLAQGRVVIAPDTPGYGMSDPPPAPTTIPDFAEHMLALTDHLAGAGVIDGTRIDVIGMHTGSLIATQMGLTAPDRVRKLGLFGLAAYPEDVRMARLATLRDKFPAPDRSLRHVEMLWAIFGELGEARMTPEYRHVAMAECLRIGHRIPWGYEAVYRYDFLGALAALSQPALVVNAQDDLWDVTHRVAHLIPHGQMLPLPGRAHGYMEFEAADIAGQLLAFLD